MATPNTSSSKKQSTPKRIAASRGKPAAQDAIALLKADHQEVKGWFEDFEKARGDSRKADLARRICLALKVHTQVEEEIFYPQTRELLADDSIVDEAVVEHDAAKKLIAEIEAMDAGGDMFDARVKVLGEMIEHHVKEEETEYFPEVRKSDADLKAMGAQMAKRKSELMAEMETGRPGLQ